MFLKMMRKKREYDLAVIAIASFIFVIALSIIAVMIFLIALFVSFLF
jgi:hypothetical protein